MLSGSSVKVEHNARPFPVRSSVLFGALFMMSRSTRLDHRQRVLAAVLA
jgi:hypothetical protein